MTITWKIIKGDQLSAVDIYQIIQMRNEVFTFEQSCLKQDADGLDLLSDTYHIMGFVPEKNKPVAYARLVYTNDDPDAIRLGRLLVVKDYRNKHLGNKLIEKTLETVEEKKVEHERKYIFAHSQFYLREWYARFGFEIEGDAFDEGRIMHIRMIKNI